MLLSSIKRLFQNKKVVIGLLALFLVGIFFLRPILFPQKNTIQSTTVKREDLKAELTLSGKIDADEKVTLQFQTGGLLTYVGVKEGDYVTKNQFIASLDQRQVKKTLQKYLNSYQKQRDTFDQTLDNNKDKVINDSLKRILDQSQLDLNNTILDVELQDLSRELSNLISPIEGIVTRVDSPLSGVNVSSLTPAQFEIVNPKTVFFVLAADQTEVINLSAGQKGEIVFDSYPGEKVSGTIKSVSFSPKKDETGTVYEAKVALSSIDNSNYKYRLFMTGDITFVTNEKKNTLYVPIQYVKSDDKAKYVFVDKNKKKLYVKTGFETDTNVEITSGLSEGNEIFE